MEKSITVKIGLQNPYVQKLIEKMSKETFRSIDEMINTGKSKN